MLFRSNKYTYKQAQEVCQALDASLASYDQIEQAYNEGAEWCNYGWSEGQMAYFPTQKATYNKLMENPYTKNACGRPGINGGFMGNPNLRFGVNCYGVKPSKPDGWVAPKIIAPKSPCEGCPPKPNKKEEQMNKMKKNEKFYTDISSAEGCFIDSGTTIGADGFGIVTDKGINHKIPHTGTVIIKDNVSIGANCCIDRGTIKNTIIKSGTKLDNLVHIAHNVEIGYNCLICGQVGIAGSTLVGDNVVMGGQVGIADNLKIGNNSIMAGKTGVSANILPRKFMMGNPAMEMKKNIASYMALRRLPKLQTKIKQLNKLINEISSKLVKD